MVAPGSPDFLRDFRPTGDGHFLIRFGERDYVLTEEQALEFGRLARNAGRMRGALATMPLFALIVVSQFWSSGALDPINLPLQFTAILALYIPLVFSVFRENRRKIAVLESYDRREVPNADGAAARLAQKLEHYRSVSQDSVSQDDDDTSSSMLMIGVGIMIFGILLMVFANSPLSATVRAALTEMLSLDSELLIEMIGLIITVLPIGMLLYFVSRGIAKRLRVVPPEARPTDDGHFLYRFRGRDYVLNREQAIRQRWRFWNPVSVWLILLVVFLVVSPGIAFDYGNMVRVSFFVVLLAWILGRHWLTAMRLKGCEFREIPEAKGIVARGLRRLEYYRSIYLRDDPPPTLLALYCLAAPVGFGVLIMGPWFPLSEYDGLELAFEAGLLIAIFAIGLAIVAVPFYALCRTIVEKRTGASRSENPPTA